MTKPALVAAVIGFLMIALGASAVTPFGKHAKSYAVEISTDAIATFVALRTINAGLSLAQEVEFTGSVGLFSGSAQPLKVLEPLDDAVEYLSTAVFIAGSVAVVAAATLEILGPIGLVVFGGGLVAIAASGLKWAPRRASAQLRRIGRQTAQTGALLYLLVLAFAAASIMNNSIGNSAWAEHKRVLEQVSKEMHEIGIAPSEDPTGLLADDLSNPDVTGEPRPSVEPTVAEDDTGVLNRFKKFSKSTREKAGDIYQDTKEAAVGAVTSLSESAQRAAHWGKVAASTASIMFRHADDLMIAFLSILAAFMFKLLALPILAYFVMVRLLRGIATAGSPR